MSAMATLSLLFMPPLYLLTDLSPKPLWNRFTLFRESSTAWISQMNSSHYITRNKEKLNQMTYSYKLYRCAEINKAL